MDSLRIIKSLQTFKYQLIYLLVIADYKSVLSFAFALFIVSITQDTSSVRDSVQAMIFPEYKSIMLVS